MLRRATTTARLIPFLLGLGVCATPACVLAQELPRGTPEEVGLSSERLARVSEVFSGYADEGRMAGAVGMVVRHGKLAWVDAWGSRDVAEQDPMQADDIFRIYSMTKPITSVAVMMLYEEGLFFLDDPVGRYLPELANLPVAKLAEATGPDDIPTERAARQMTIRDLLRHTSGLTYGTFSNTAVDQLYRRDDVGNQTTLADMVTALSDVPLAYHPGTTWNYSLSTDVLGRLVEVLSGQTFDAFLRERIFEPLGMDDTGFFVRPADRDRFAQIYGHAGGRGGPLTLEAQETGGYTPEVTRFSGGGGLVSTARDYSRFAQMLLNGGELDGYRILSPTTIDLMTTDHLGDDGTSFLAPGWGFGLGFTIKNQPALDGLPDSVGTYYWFGVAGTSFWIDPDRDLIGIFMIQIRPNRDVNFRDQFKRLVYQAVVD
ncbi:MAG: beta-lactamase family protein [Gemmatimonadota bacterium]|nr:beta-lactamase family protein [Gemmatimonadota bacterium]